MKISDNHLCRIMDHLMTKSNLDSIFSCQHNRGRHFSASLSHGTKTAVTVAEYYKHLFIGE